MSGYIGNPDAEAEHAQILNENAIESARAELPDPSKTYIYCIDCGEEIPPLRREKNKGCTRCVECQTLAEKAPRARIKMLDRIL